MKFLQRIIKGVLTMNYFLLHSKVAESAYFDNIIIAAAGETNK